MMQTAEAQTRTDDYRARLLAALQDAIAEIGFAPLTVADVVRRARVSKRTFYQHFDSKEAALLALFEARSDEVLAAIQSAIAPLPPGEARIVAGTAAYLNSLQSDAGAVRTRFIEILHLGERGLAVRRMVLRRFGAMLMSEMEAAGTRIVLTPALATAIVGGINELVLEALEEDGSPRLTELAPAVTALIRGFLK